MAGLECPDGLYVMTGFDATGRPICRPIEGADLFLGAPVTVTPPTDGDGDGIPDDDDTCPTAPGLFCPTTAYEVNSGAVPTGSYVSFEVVVTAVNVPDRDPTDAMGALSYGQVPPTSSGYAGPENSGITFSAPVGNIGDLVQVYGVVLGPGLVSGGGQILSTDHPVEPVAIDVGAFTDEYLAVLIRVDDAVVTGLDGTDWVVADAVTVSPATGSLPVVSAGTTVSSITGVLTFGPTLVPRGPADIVLP